MFILNCLFLYVVNSVCQLGALRLVGGRNNLEGRVEVCECGVCVNNCDDCGIADVTSCDNLVTLECVYVISHYV